jgi:hypothetical protein
MLDPDTLEDPDDPFLLFDELSASIIDIPELRPHEYPRLVLAPYPDRVVPSKPDSAIEAFARRAKAELKAVMRDEVDQPSSFANEGSEFNPQHPLIPRRPWLNVRIPIVLPLTNNIRPAAD